MIEKQPLRADSQSRMTLLQTIFTFCSRNRFQICYSRLPCWGLQIKALHNLRKLFEFVFNLFQYMQIFIYLLCIAVRWKFRSFRWPPVQRIKFKLLRENSKREKQWIFQSSHSNFTLKSVCQTNCLIVEGNSNCFPKDFFWLMVFAAFVCWTPVHVGQCVQALMLK